MLKSSQGESPGESPDELPNHMWGANFGDSLGDSFGDRERPNLKQSKKAKSFELFSQGYLPLSQEVKDIGLQPTDTNISTNGKALSNPQSRRHTIASQLWSTLSRNPERP